MPNFTLAAQLLALAAAIVRILAWRLAPRRRAPARAGPKRLVAEGHSCRHVARETVPAGTLRGKAG